MSTNIRPVAVTTDPITGWAKSIQNQHNANNLVAGSNVIFNRGSNHTNISVDLGPEIEHLVYRGDFDITAEYKVNDVVRVFPTTQYYDSGSKKNLEIDTTATDGYTHCPITPGLYVCVTYVPPSYADTSYLDSINYQFTTIPYELQNGIRFYDKNVYYPIYPEIPSQYTSSVDTGYGFQITANNTFWRALSPMLKMQSCVNNETQTMYIGGIVSGSLFKTSYLPYSSSTPTT